MFAVCALMMLVRHPCYFLRACASKSDTRDGAFVCGQRSRNVVLQLTYRTLTHTKKQCADCENSVFGHYKLKSRGDTVVVIL